MSDNRTDWVTESYQETIKPMIGESQQPPSYISTCHERLAGVVEAGMRSWPLAERITILVRAFRVIKRELEIDASSNLQYQRIFSEVKAQFLRVLPARMQQGPIEEQARMVVDRLKEVQIQLGRVSVLNTNQFKQLEEVAEITKLLETTAT